MQERIALTPSPGLTLRHSCAQVDVYSFGVVLWELVTKEQALRGQLRNVLVPSECPQVKLYPARAC